MLLAIIPFIADGVANDWQKAVACLDRTLRSILGNPERDLRAMVVCQDRPPLKLNDERYLFLETRQPKPDKQDVMAKYRTGYEWREGSSHFSLRPSFNQVCSTAFVWRFNERLFPAWLGKTYTKRICDQGHNLVEAAMDAEGFQVDKIYKPKAVYVTGHLNHLDETLHHVTIKRRIKDLVLSTWRDRRLTPELKTEFGLLHESTK